jgi:ribonuclease HI
MESNGNEPKNNIEIHCDGSCVNQTGGIGIIIITPAIEVLISKGTFYNTTNNRMELLAFLYSVYYIQPYVKNHEEVSIFCDSKYVVDGYNQWMNNWSKNHWKTAGNNDVLNLDLWLEVFTIKKIFNYKVIWEKGHDTNVYNNKADILAKLGGQNSNFCMSYQRCV